jgi:SulP family sulfate permease
MAIDASGLRSLEDVLERTRREGTVLVLTGVRAQVLDALRASGLYDRIGHPNVCNDLDAALAHARALTEPKE